MKSDEKDLFNAERDYDRLESDYFDKKGNPITLEEFVRLFEKKGYKVIKQERIGKYIVSTVWLGVSHGFYGQAPIIFETMIFCDEGKNDSLYLWQDRYTTEEEALEGHKKAVDLVKQQSNGNNCEEDEIENMKKMEKTYRYVCPHCLRTFLSNEYHEDWFCWECGQALEVIPKEVDAKQFQKKDDEFIRACLIVKKTK